MDDLTAPLKVKRPKLAEKAGPLAGVLRWLKSIPIAPVLTGAIIVIALAAMAYVRFAGNPLGGEPVAMIALDDSTQAKPKPDAMKGAVQGKAPEQAINTVEDITRGGASDIIDTGDGGAKVIIIRPEDEITHASLPPVPDSRLIERTPAGLLPQRASDGTAPASVYARQYAFDDRQAGTPRPRIAILVNGMGLNRTQTTEAIRQMPPPVTFAFAAYGNDLQGWASSARQAGHEVMLQIPLEPFDYPDNDPGPHTLLTSLTPSENLTRLHWLMARMVGYTGLTNYMGARFTASREVLRPALLEMKKRGLLFIDDGTSPRSLVEEVTGEIGMPARQATLVLDAVPAPDAITASIERLEISAFQNGVALGVISALPVSIKTVAEWLNTLESRGFELIPVSASTKIAAEG